MRSKGWSVPAHESIGYISRGLADAPNPKGRGAERVHNLKVLVGKDDVVDGWRWAPWDLIGEQWGSHNPYVTYVD